MSESTVNKETPTPYWEKIKDAEDEMELHQIVPAFICPPEKGKENEILNAIVFTKSEKFNRIYNKHESYPSLISPDSDLLKEKQDQFEKAGVNVFPCKIVQMTTHKQFVIIKDEIYRVNGCSISREDDVFEIRVKCDFYAQATGDEATKAFKMGDN